MLMQDSVLHHVPMYFATVSMSCKNLLKYEAFSEL